MRTLQQPIPSGFGPATTAAEVLAGVDLSGKVAIVTGGYSGLGLETVRSLRAAGASVIVPTRDLPKARAALAGNEGVDIQPMDLLDPASIDRFAEGFLASARPLHMLINSAAIMALPERTLDARGYELQFATNHLGHFQLTARLWPALLAARGARVVSVSSLGHRFSPVLFEDPHFERHPYGPWLGYGQSKTANALFAVSLDARGRDRRVRAFSVHPGSIVGTGLDKHVPIEDLQKAGILDAHRRPVIDPRKKQKTVAMGAATQVWCATSRQLDGLGGVYCEDVDVAPLMPDGDGSTMSLMAARDLGGVKAYAVEPEAAERLWSLSEQLLGRAARL
jgi:NAD(P)-dependent dehydrogenase (short-subunit alcohol dehydrogenase family)